MSTYDENLEFYNRLVEMNPNFERKGKTMPYTSANGYMFSQLNKNGEIGIRLSKDSKKEFMAKYNAEDFISYGAKMRGYVRIPEVLFSDIDMLSALLEESYQFVMSLPPK